MSRIWLLCYLRLFKAYLSYTKLYTLTEEFGASSKKKECEMDCPEPCEQVEYKTSFSYSGLQRKAIIEHLMSFLNTTKKLPGDRAIYKPLLNMTRAEREKYIE